MVLIPRIRPQSPSRPSRHAHCWLFLALLISTTANAADARPSPHRHVPAKNLIAYFEFEGLGFPAATPRPGRGPRSTRHLPRPRPAQ